MKHDLRRVLTVLLLAGGGLIAFGLSAEGQTGQVPRGVALTYFASDDIYRGEHVVFERLRGHGFVVPPARNIQGLAPGQLQRVVRDDLTYYQRLGVPISIYAGSHGGPGPEGPFAGLPGGRPALVASIDRAVSDTGVPVSLAGVGCCYAGDSHRIVPPDTNVPFWAFDSPPGRQAGVADFAWAFNRAMSNEADRNNDGVTTAGEVFDFMKANYPRFSLASKPAGADTPVSATPEQFAQYRRTTGQREPQYEYKLCIVVPPGTKDVYPRDLNNALTMAGRLSHAGELAAATRNVPQVNYGVIDPKEAQAREFLRHGFYTVGSARVIPGAYTVGRPITITDGKQEWTVLAKKDCTFEEVSTPRPTPGPPGVEPPGPGFPGPGGGPPPGFDPLIFALLQNLGQRGGGPGSGGPAPQGVTPPRPPPPAPTPISAPRPSLDIPGMVSRADIPERLRDRVTRVLLAFLAAHPPGTAVPETVVR